MNKARKKFIAYTMLAVTVMLASILVLINVISFTAAATDADRITETLAAGKGMFPGQQSPEPASGNPDPGNRTDFRGAGFGRMGPDSPELKSTIRYFTVRIDEDGGAVLTSKQMTAFDDGEALSLAESLSEKGGTGWTGLYYRYRVYKVKNTVYVTVIDQGRELLPSYRILLVSVTAGLAGLAASFLFLVLIGRKTFRPVEDADRKQKRFIADAEKEIKIPLTVIGADVEYLERTHGPDDSTASIRRQVQKLSGLVKKIGALSVSETPARSECDLSAVLGLKTDRLRPAFEKHGVSVRTSVTPGIRVNADPETLSKMVSEILENALKFSVSEFELSLVRENDRIILRAENDTSLTVNGPVEEAFDRFTVLENSGGEAGTGLGLSFLRDAAVSMDWRTSAEVRDGRFILVLMI